MKIFYHSADPDGWCSAAIIYHSNPKAELYGINFGEHFPWEWIDKNDEVWMVDFCTEPFEQMIKLNNSCKKLVWIDHHISAIQHYKKSGIKLDGKQEDGRGACLLVWQYLYPEKMIPMAIKLIAASDVGDKSLPKAESFVYGILSHRNPHPSNVLLWNTLFLYDDYKVEQTINKIIQRGEVVLDYLSTTNADYAKSYSFDTEIEGYTVLACNNAIAGSRLFDSVWDTHKYDIMCTFCRLPSKRWTVSLYTDKSNIDVSEIAIKFGGGGHKGAAGFQCDNLPFCF